MFSVGAERLFLISIIGFHRFSAQIFFSRRFIVNWSVFGFSDIPACLFQQPLELSGPLSDVSPLPFPPLQGCFIDPFIRAAREESQAWMKSAKKKTSLTAKLLLCKDRASVELRADVSGGHVYELIFPLKPKQTYRLCPLRTVMGSVPSPPQPHPSNSSSL